MQDLRKLSDYAEAEIEKLTDEGIRVTPRDVVLINALAWACETPTSRLQLARGTPIFVGSVALWPLTIYAADWYSRHVQDLRDKKTKRIALAYAMAYGRSENGGLETPPCKLEGALKRWYATLRCTPAELSEALSQVIEQDEPTTDTGPIKEDKMTLGELSCTLAGLVGGAPEMWERRVAIGYACDVFDVVLQQNKADDKPSDNDPRIRAERSLGWLLERIRKRERA